MSRQNEASARIPASVNIIYVAACANYVRAYVHTCDYNFPGTLITWRM